VCVLAFTVAIGVAVNAGARAGGLVQVGDPSINFNGKENFGGGTWTASASGADYDKPGGAGGSYAGHFTWTIPRNIPAGGADASLIVTSEGRTARYNACAGLAISGFTISNGPSGNQLCTLAEVGRTESTTANFRLTPSGSSGSIVINMQDGPSVTFLYAPPQGGGDPCATAKRACETKELPAPAPGTSATVKGSIAKGVRKAGVTVDSSAGSLVGTTLVGKGSVKPSEKAGEAVASCWLTGPEALFPSKAELSAFLEKHNFRDDFDELAKDPREFFIYCTNLVGELLGEGRSRHAGGGCAQQIVVSAKEKGQKVLLKLAKANALPKSAVKYSCAETADGGADITVTSSNKKGLRGELGKSLDFGVVSAADAPSGATLTFGFSS
jgi:hypothetical protein